MSLWLWKGRGNSQELIHCRHCLRPFERTHMLVECRSRTCEVRDEVGVLGPRRFDAAEAGLWRDGRLHLDEEACPYCDVTGSLETVCPHCRQPLGIDQGEDQVFAIIGASAAGKTHFLAAVLHQLLEAEGAGSAWKVALSEAEMRVFRERYLDPLFEELRVLSATPHGLEAELRLTLENVADGRRVLLVFRDLSGEIFVDPELLSRLSFLRYARGVLLMTDPLAFPPPAGRTPGDAAAATQSALAWRENGQPDALEILTTYRQVLEDRDRKADEAALPLRPEDKVLAVTVTKVDLVLPAGHPFWQPERDGHLEAGFWERRGDEGAEVLRWVEENLSRKLVRETRSFADVGWFFTSSIGYPLQPDRDRLPRPPQPRRVLEPIFGLLDRLTAAEDAGDGGGDPPAGGRPGPRRRDRGEDWGL